MQRETEMIFFRGSKALSASQPFANRLGPCYSIKQCTKVWLRSSHFTEAETSSQLPGPKNVMVHPGISGLQLKGPLVGGGGR